MTNALALLRLLPLSDRDKDAEILALRHQVMVLQRQVHGDRVRCSRADRAWLAALLHPLPGTVLNRLRLPVRPETMLRWHRDLIGRRHARRSRPRTVGRPRTVRSTLQVPKTSSTLFAAILITEGALSAGSPRWSTSRAGRRWGVLFRLAYIGGTNTLALLRLLPMGDRDKDAEILALRHQVMVLERQLHGDRVRFTRADRAWLAALLHTRYREPCCVTCGYW